MKLGYLALYMNKSQLPEFKKQLVELTVEKVFIDFPVLLQSLKLKNTISDQPSI
ncbi:hypothetical protein ACOMX4_002776 [Enterococcus faecalis]